MNSASFSVGRHELDHRRASMLRTTARNSAPDPGYPEGARAEKRSASRKPSVVTSVDRDESGRRLRGLQIARRLLAPLGHDVVADLLAFHQATHAGALHRADVHEHVLAAVARLDESKAFLGIEELHGTCGHYGLLALHCVLSDDASIAWPVIQFWGSWLGTVKRERREADRKLVAGCYLCDRGRNVNPDSGINPAQAVALGNRRSRRGVEWHRYQRFVVEELAAVRALGRGCRSLPRPTPKAIADPATFFAQRWRCFAEPVTLKAARSFASHPAGLRLPRARLCAAQPSPPFFFVFPRCVRVLPAVARPGLDGNSA